MASTHSTGGLEKPDDEPVGERYQIRATGDAAKNYDYVSARGLNRKTNNVGESIGHMIKSCLGGGLMAIHESYKACGLWTSLVLNAFFGVAVSYCMFTLARSAHLLYGRVQVPLMTYPDLAEASMATAPWPKMRKYAKCFRFMVGLMISLELFGACCVYQVVMARSIKQLVDGTQTYQDTGYPSIRVYVMVLVFPCILICMITTLKYLAPFTIVGDVFILTVAIATVYYGSKKAERSPLEMPVFKNMAGLFEFIGVCGFSMEGFGATMAIENNMANPKKIPLVIFGSMSIVVSAVMVIGFFGYWGFGEKAQSPITVNFPFEVFPIILKVLMATMIYITFALNFWIPFELFWLDRKLRYNPEKHWLWQRLYRILFVVIITGIAIIFPNVSKFIGVIGSICVSNMGFIFPALIELTINWENPGLGYMYWRLWKAIAIMLFGVTLCIIGTYINVKELIRAVFR